MDQSNGLSLNRLNLNLLVALDALLRERSVTRAAERLHISQSALSHTLQKLREQLGDALLVRGRGGLLLTPRAERLSRALQVGLGALERALVDNGSFDPKLTRRCFRLAASDSIGLSLIPLLAQRIEQEGAEGISLDVVPADLHDPGLQIESQLIDLSFCVEAPKEASLRRRVLFREDYCCLLRRDHPRVQGHMDLDTYTELPHVLISPRGEGPSLVDQALGRLGRARRVALRVRYFLVAPLVVERTDWVLTLPRRVAERCAHSHGLQVVPAPVELPRFDQLMLWHERCEDDAAHRWLRDLVVGVLPQIQA